MITIMLAVAVVLLIIAILMIGILLWRNPASELTHLKSILESADARASLESVEKGQERTQRAVREEIGTSREEAGRHAKQLREELSTLFKGFNDSTLKQMKDLTQSNEQRLNTMRELIERKLDTLRNTVDDRLKQMQADNTKKLDQMRVTVDEKLEGTLQKRLGESFKLVSERLERVHKGLGEMQELASGVGDLKRVLTNVKTRGTWGEIQLGNLLEQILAEQYSQNVATKDSGGERVEFAIKLPGRDAQQGDAVYLPIDAKFPKEDYKRLIDAQEKANAEAAEDAAKALERRVNTCAKDISTKYLNPPKTTDFGIMFLPTEGLYAEVVRRVGLLETIQREYRVVVAGPTTLAALLNSLQMGFRTLAIQQRSSEVWTLLAAVKTQFAKYGEVLGKVRKKLGEAFSTIDNAEQRTRVIERKLRDVEQLPASDARALLPASEGPGDEQDDGGGV